MLTLAYAVGAMLLANPALAPADTVPKTAIVPSAAVIAPLVIERPSALAILHRTGLGIADPAASDTVRKPRRKAFEYSDGYQTRLKIHEWLSWTMLPLFAASYITGNEMLSANADGRTPKSWAKTWHGPAASGSAVLFGANTITGAWNLYEGIGDPNGRKRRVVHSVLFMAASAGFVYAGTQLADDAEQSQQKRTQHRNVAVASMSVSTLSWLIMLIGN